MEQETKKINKPMFWIGMIMIVIVAILLSASKEDLGIWPMVFGIMGIVFIGASQYRPIK